MGIFKNRPLFSVTCAVMITSLLGFFLIPRAKVLIAVLCLAVCGTLGIGLIIRKRKLGLPCPGSRLLICGLLLFVSLTLFRSVVVIDRAEAEAKGFEGEACEVEATVTERRGSGGNMSSYVLDVSSVNGETVHYNALLTCYYVADLKPGFTVRLTAEAVSLSESSGDVYEEYALMGDGIFGGFLSMTDADCHIISEDPPSLRLRIARHRISLSEELKLRFGDKAGGLPSSLLLGDRSHLPTEVKRDFARTGVSHLLAISGLHMTLIFGMLAAILKFVGIPPRVRALPLGLGAPAYLFYLGFPPSATRAVIMLGMTYLATLCFAGADSLTSLGVAGAGILLVSPLTVADVGFWMSFSTAFSLLTVLPMINPPVEAAKKPGLVRQLWRRGVRKVLYGLAAGVVAVTFSLWITVPVMGEISWFSAPFTLLLTPLIGLLLVLVPLSVLLSNTPLTPLLDSAIQGISSAITELCETGARQSWAVLSLRDGLVTIVVLLMVVLTLLLMGLSLKKKGWIMAPMAAGWLAILLILGIRGVMGSQEIQASYLTASSTSEMMVMTRGQEAVIFDLSGGSRRAFTAAANEAAQQGATEISALILTDYHSATAGVLYRFVRSETVRALWLPRPTCEEDYYLMLSCLEAVEDTDTSVTVYRHGEDLTLFGQAKLTVERTMISRSVRPVLLLSLQTPAHEMTLCGRSILESDLKETALRAMTHSDTVILSNIGPEIREKMNCAFDHSTEQVCLANETVAAHLSPEGYPHDDTLVTIGSCRFTIKIE